MTSSTLPQHDAEPEPRRRALEAARAAYVYDPHAPIGRCAGVPAEEAVDLGGRLAPGLPANALAVKLRTLFDPFDELQDYDDLFTLIARPAIAGTWRDDAAFAEQRLSGVECRLLRRLERLPDNLGLEPGLFAAVAGEPLDRALFDGRLYLADYAALGGLAPGGARDRSKFLHAPLALYRWVEDPDATRDTPPSQRGRLLPVAIQVDQTPGKANLYTPRDGLEWLLARTVAQSAEYTVSTLAHHLARAHFGLEAFAMATARQLDLEHPLRRLLRPHLRGVIAQAEHSRRTLLDPGGPVERLFGPTLEASLELVRRGVRDWHLDAWSLPRDLELRGLADDLLPHYPWRDDGRLLWDALAEFVAAFLHWCYPTDLDLALDHEVRGWLAELADPAGGRLQGIPSAPERAGLADLLTTLLFAGGPGHSALHYVQAEYAVHVPNLPMALYSPMPAVRGAADESHLLAMLPPQAASLEQIELVTRMTAHRAEAFGQYEDDDQLHEPPELHDLVVRLQERLVSAEQRILQRNRERAVPYLGMLPSRITNSAGA